MRSNSTVSQGKTYQRTQISHCCLGSLHAHTKIGTQANIVHDRVKPHLNRYQLIESWLLIFVASIPYRHTQLSARGYHGYQRKCTNWCESAGDERLDAG
jgi:hypothetical protein